MVKGGVIGVVTASLAFEYFEWERLNEVFFILLGVQVIQLICQMIRFESQQQPPPSLSHQSQWKAFIVYVVLVLAWVGLILFLFGGTKLYLFLVQLAFMNYFFFFQ